jgi:uroporphyrinogen-III synthase
MSEKFFYFFRSKEDFQRLLQSNAVDSKLMKNEVFFDEKFLDIDQSLISKCDLLIITSRMAVKSLLKSGIKLQEDQSVLIVGESTAKLLNMNNIEFIANNIGEITEYIEKNIDRRKKILYLRGNYITFDIKKYFSSSFEIDELEVYNLKYHKYLSDNFLKDLTAGKISRMAFFSFKSLEQFVNVIVNVYKMSDYLSQIEAFVVNEKSRDLADSFFKNVTIFRIDHFVKSINL